ncbi:hypothetical protein [Archaeoglobus profundus]|uniref:Uncharacterized protein n=1 Tax=Archaeoglobus profundus (strain DSM 5631 / JCM 9629 / NBRC 100127 / Av18) TaxID=572546 RepID=D2REW8_ARCPA|nr:hypothetical protein [Archaeoglobus profundus]ADB58662.1 hypothetical protein Arcpr_1616 [Archaeoglobus profundus DSM 5631]
MVREAVERLIQLIEEEKIDFSEFEVLLSAEEKTILNVLKRKKRAMNINEIRNTIIDDFIKLIKYYGQIKELEDKIRSYSEERKPIYPLQRISEKKYSNRLNLKFNIDKSFNIKVIDISSLENELNNLKRNKPRMEFWEGEFEDIPELFIKVYEELKQRKILKNGKILERDKRVVAELINKHGIARIPSYKTIERILTELEAGGLVVSRPDSGGRGKKLYAINPKLLKKLEE